MSKLFLKALLLFSISCFSCNDKQNKMLIGKWEVVNVVNLTKSDSLDSSYYSEWVFKEKKVQISLNGRKRSDANWFLRNDSIQFVRGSKRHSFELLFFNEDSLALRGLLNNNDYFFELSKLSPL